MIRALASAAALAFAALAFGFVLFAGAAMREPRASPRADAIVVLTGGEQRIREASRLLAEGRGRRLLISGINPVNSGDDVRRLSGLSRGTFECCVDLGYRAQDTVGNAAETKGWVERWRYRRLIVVTGSYHMPRSLAELSRSMPNVELVPHQVVPRSFQAEPWWLSRSTARILLSEYIKYLPSAALLAAARLQRPLDAAAGATRPAHATAAPAG